MKERDDLKTECDKMYTEKENISQQLEENTIILENAIESRDEKIYKLEKELERFEDEVIVSSIPSCEKCESESKTLNNI